MNFWIWQCNEQKIYFAFRRSLKTWMDQNLDLESGFNAISWMASRIGLRVIWYDARVAISGEQVSRTSSAQVRLTHFSGCWYWRVRYCSQQSTQVKISCMQREPFNLSNMGVEARAGLGTYFKQSSFLPNHHTTPSDFRQWSIVVGCQSVLSESKSIKVLKAKKGGSVRYGLATPLLVPPSLLIFIVPK